MLRHVTHIICCILTVKFLSALLSASTNATATTVGAIGCTVRMTSFGRRSNTKGTIEFLVSNLPGS